MDDNKIKKGIDRSNLNTLINPADDFYEFACGGWIRNNPLTDEYSSFGTFDLLREKARDQVKDLVQNISKDSRSSIPGTISQKIKDLYCLGMNADRLNSEGVKPLEPVLELLNTKISGHDLTSLIAWLHSGLDSAFFSSGVGPDPANSDLNILHLGEAGLSLGDRDYYLEDNEENKKILEAFEIYVKKIMSLAGYSDTDAQRVWETVIEIETRIAEHKMTREQRRDPSLRHNIFSVDELKETLPFINWERYFEELGLNGIKSLNINSVDYIKFINSYIGQLTDKQLEDFLAYNLITNSSGLMNDEFIDANFELYGKVMSGQKEQKPRWKRVLGILNSMFGEAIGELYVAKYFSQENKENMLKLVANLKKSLGKHIQNLTWMSEETKCRALDKLDAMTVKIGYPDKWKDYSEIQINPEESFLMNVQKASQWFTKDNYSKVNKPVDKSEWHMTPQTVNAYYSPIVNEICFPAAILQPPYFDPEADEALNYGAIGVVIGHEMTHGFDDQGRQFDKNGNLVDWWQPEDAEKFKSLTEKLVKQFDSIEIAPGVNANGRFTLGENIADQGGLNVALSAYIDNINNQESIDGFSPLQRFFLSYAGVWAGSIRDEEKILRTKTDPHSLGKNRVNATLKNIDEFFDAFSIEKGNSMYRPLEERVIIW
ncbi:MAG: M13 family metallopeptidase [Muribaculaceae bacterium]|nr:M13 family metallopeptidase [Muribaculaceae bacterium]